MKRITLLFCLLVSWAHASELAALQQQFEQKLFELDEKKQVAVKAWSKAYLLALDDVETEYQRMGKLEPVLVVRGESERFLTERSLPVENSTLERLAKVQRAARERLDKILAVEAAEQFRLAGTYDKALEVIQKKLTQEQRIEEALAVRTERQSLPERFPEPVVTVPAKEDVQPPAPAFGLNRLQIVSARYGAGDRWADVTKKVQGLVKRNRLEVKASNTVFGDPARGITKSLEVNYTLNGKAGQARVGEHGTLTLPE